MSHVIEIARKHPGNRGEFIEKKDLIKAIAESSNEPLFRSYYSFDNNILEHVNQFNSIKGYNGVVYCDQIILDIDRGQDTIDHLVDRLRKFIDLLIGQYKFPEEYIQPYYSGSGYHIRIPDVFGFIPSPSLPRIVKDTLVSYFPQADPIYDYARLIRVPYTINEKTGLYKVPLTIDEIFDLSALGHQQIASKGVKRDIKINNVEKAERLLDIKVNKPSSSTNIVNHYTNNDSNTNAIATCVQKMYHEGPQQGTRHDKLMAIGSVWMRQGIPEQATSDSLKAWAHNEDESEVSRVIHDVYENNYRPSCNHPVLDKYCDEKCIFYGAKKEGKDGLLHVKDAKTLEEKFAEHVQTEDLSDRINIKDTMTWIPEDFFIKPGHMTTLLGNTGMGKTAFLQWLITKFKKKTLWLSLEMDELEMYSRFVQIVNGMTTEQVYEHYKTNANTLSKDLNYINIIIDHMELQSIKRLVAIEQPEILVIDTIDAVNVPRVKQGTTEHIDTVINGVREMTNRNRTISFVVSHVSKAASENSLNVLSGKGSTHIATKSDNVVSIEGERHSAKRMFKVHKARSQDAFTTHLSFNPQVFDFTKYESKL
jgi:archaellum biogenesis ATPase FlaH